ncbi:hypothetical protein LCGC14_1340240 [marine sediment metagenome]|uniref:Uncharacterized protein n=1 Tax=marine sediment metagenome TaxID=412755 RepID=A0A0F9L0A2_9ZZZZ
MSLEILFEKPLCQQELKIVRINSTEFERNPIYIAASLDTTKRFV